MSSTHHHHESTDSISQEKISAVIEKLHVILTPENMESNADLAPCVSATTKLISIPMLAESPLLCNIADEMTLRFALAQMNNITIIENAFQVHFKAEQNTLILRDINSQTPVDTVSQIFLQPLPNSMVCPAVKNVRGDMNNTWFVTFGSEKDARYALECIKHMKFNDAPVRARLKTESLSKSFFNMPAPPMGSPHMMPMMPPMSPGMMPPYYYPYQQSPHYFPPPANWGPSPVNRGAGRGGGRGMNRAATDEAGVEDRKKGKKTKLRKSRSEEDGRDGTNRTPRNGRAEDKKGAVAKKKLAEFSMSDFPALDNNGSPTRQVEAATGGHWAAAVKKQQAPVITAPSAAAEDSVGEEDHHVQQVEQMMAAAVVEAPVKEAKREEPREEERAPVEQSGPPEEASAPAEAPVCAAASEEAKTVWGSKSFLEVARNK